MRVDIPSPPKTGPRGDVPGVARLTTLSNLVLLGIVALVTWLALSTIERQVREDVGQALDTVLETSHSSLRVWSQTQRAHVEDLAQDPEVVRLTRDLVDGPSDRVALLASPVQSDLRAFFGKGAARYDLKGFFIIAPDGRSLASMRDANVGTRNLIIEHRPRAFDRALRGGSTIVPPLTSDVPLVDESGLRGLDAPTMFVVAPVLSGDGSVLALLALRLDPLREFSRLAEIARVGKSGETYAFDAEGRLLTDTRFADDLRAAGVLAPEQSPILNLRVVDPGQRLEPGRLRGETEHDRELTRAAAAAVSGSRGRDLQGYRDYRGIEVIGTWMWSHDLGVGLVSEIDADEALRPYYSTRFWIVALLATVALLSVFLTWLVHWVRGRGVRALADREDRLRAIVDTTVDAIITIDAEGRIATFNAAAESMFKYVASEAIGRHVSVLLASRDADKLDRYMRTGDTSGIGVGHELQGQRRDSTTFPLEMGVAEIPASKQQGPRFTAILRDITARKSLEKQFLQSQKMEAVGHLAAGVAHDFNNLLMGVSGSAKVALNRIEDRERVRTLLEEICGSATTGAAITRQLLAVTRTRDTKPVDIELDAVVESSRGMLTRLLGEDIRLGLQLHAPGLWLRGGDGAVEQVLINLVVNARDAMPQGGDLSISTAEHAIAEDSAEGGPKPGPYVVLEVRDSGVGMDEETQERIFEPFFTTKEPGKGTGLGLSTVFGIAARSGGFVEVDSRVGVGTTFRLSFPQVEPPPATEQREEQTIPPLPSMTVLVVEDESLVRDTICHFMRASGHRVLSASGRREAKEMCAQHDGPIDILISDVVLRGDPGPLVATDLRARDPDVRVLFVSAHPAEYLWRTGRVEPATAVLQKPFDQRDLDEQIRALVEEMHDSPGQDEARPAGDDLAVLLVEDQDSTRDLTAELLEDEGFRVLPARDGAEAQRLFTEHGGKVVVVTDFGLPDISGPKLVDRLSSEHPLRRVIYVSGRSKDDPEVRSAMDRAATSYLAKPIDFDELIGQLRQSC